MKLTWTADPSAEPALKEFGVKYEVGSVDLADIDWDLSRDNHARIIGKQIDEDLVAEYALAMERGDAFPMPVVRKQGRKYVVMGGNHRFQAVKLLDGTKAECYIVSTSDGYTIDMLPRVLNRRGGRRTSADEAYQHALYAMNKYGITIKEAAAAFGVSDKALGNKVQVNELRGVLVGKGVPADKLTDEACRLLAVVKNNENVLVSAANLVHKSKFVGHETKDFVNKIKSARTEASAMAVVAEYEDKLGTKNGKPEAKRAQKVVRMKFLRSLTGIESVIQKANSLARLQITEPEEKSDVAKRLTDLSGKCRRLAQSS